MINTSIKGVTNKRMIQLLRGLSIQSTERQRVLKLNKTKKANGLNRNGTIKWETFVKCYYCDHLFKEKFIEVDHVTPIGSFLGNWDIYIPRMFCGEDNLCCTCRVCHRRKTLFIDTGKIRSAKQLGIYPSWVEPSEIKKQLQQYIQSISGEPLEFPTTNKESLEDIDLGELEW